jgi:phosphoadenosine phosphosulfate reductase
MTERDVWDATWTEVVPGTVEDFPVNGLFPQSADREDLYGHPYSNLPVCPRYYNGYRSVDSVTTAKQAGDAPAWCLLSE